MVDVNWSLAAVTNKYRVSIEYNLTNQLLESIPKEVETFSQ